MDIAALSVISSQNQLMLDISTAMLAKSLDTVETTGANMVQMMEQSVAPHIGGSIDIHL